MQFFKFQADERRLSYSFLVLQNNNNYYNNLINYCCFKLFFDLLDECFHFRESVRKYAWIWIKYYGTKNNIFTWNDFSIFKEIN